MATVITIKDINPTLGTNTESVDIYIYDSASTNLWIGSVPGVTLGASLTAIQAQLDANAATLLNQFHNDTPVATGTDALRFQWIAAHKVWRRTLMNALWTLANGKLTVGTFTLANYQSIFPPVLTIIGNLPTQFQTLLTNERTAKAATNNPPATLAECRLLDDVLSLYLNERVIMADASLHIEEWL